MLLLPGSGRPWDPPRHGWIRTPHRIRVPLVAAPIKLAIPPISSQLLPERITGIFGRGDCRGLYLRENAMLGISVVDGLVIAGYLVLITVIGVTATKRVRSTASYFMGDRSFGKVMMMLFTFGTGTHSDQAVSVAAKTYRVGASGIWYQWLWLFSTPFYWVLAPIFRRMRAVTTGDYFEARYDRGVAGLFAFVGMLQLMVNIGVMLKGSAAMITAVSGGAIDPNWAILAMTVMFVIYGVAGGLSAAIITDFIQGILTIVLSFLILPYALDAVGGLAGLRETIGDPAMFEIVAPSDITTFYIAVISFNALVGWVTQPHCMGLCAAGKTEMEGRVGVMCGILIKRVCTIAWVLTGLCAVGLYRFYRATDLSPNTLPK